MLIDGHTLRKDNSPRVLSLSPELGRYEITLQNETIKRPTGLENVRLDFMDISDDIEEGITYLKIYKQYEYTVIELTYKQSEELVQVEMPYEDEESLPLIEVRAPERYISFKFKFNEHGKLVSKMASVIGEHKQWLPFMNLYNGSSWNPHTNSNREICIGTRFRNLEYNNNVINNIVHEIPIFLNTHSNLDLNFVAPLLNRLDRKYFYTGGIDRSEDYLANMGRYSVYLLFLHFYRELPFSEIIRKLESNNYDDFDAYVKSPYDDSKPLLHRYVVERESHHQYEDYDDYDDYDEDDDY